MTQLVKREATLTLNQEDNPSQYFTLEYIASFRASLQEQTNCHINDTLLSQIINEWIDDISVGYRDTTLTIDPPPLEFIDPQQFQDHGNLELPLLRPPNLDDYIPDLFVLPPLNFP